VFHYYIGPSKLEDLAQLPAHRLFHVQFSDLAGIPRELATDSDRILPGDGDFALRPIVDYLRTIDYQGGVSVELFNPTIWQVPPGQVAEVSITALRKVLGLAQ
jgi:sugar phosphate isomerase/epimerase